MSSNTSLSRRLEGKVAIVTGGASGIGATTVTLFHHHGAKVVIADIQDNLGQTLAGNLSENEAEVIYIHCDVTDEKQVEALVDATVSKFGRLDIMYSNAGVLPTTYSWSVLDADKESLERMLGVNLVGAVLAAKHAAKAMIPTKKGCIVFTASVCTEIAGAAEVGYAASKYGIVGLMKGLAAELGSHGIRVNCVSPSGVLTGSHADDEVTRGMFDNIMSEAGNLKGKVLKLEDVANAVLYLASDEAGFVSGLNLVVDGGYSVVNPSLGKAMRGVGM